MPTQMLCAGGCGTPLSKTNKNGFAWGHVGGCKTSPPPSALDAIPDEAAEVEAEQVCLVELSEAQLERIWQSLPLGEKALAITTALTAERA